MAWGGLKYFGLALIKKEEGRLHCIYSIYFRFWRDSLRSNQIKMPAPAIEKVVYSPLWWTVSLPPFISVLQLSPDVLPFDTSRSARCLCLPSYGVASLTNPRITVESRIHIRVRGLNHRVWWVDRHAILLVVSKGLPEATMLKWQEVGVDQTVRKESIPSCLLKRTIVLIVYWTDKFTLKCLWKINLLAGIKCRHLQVSVHICSRFNRRHYTLKATALWTKLNHLPADIEIAHPLCSGSKTFQLVSVAAHHKDVPIRLCVGGSRQHLKLYGSVVAFDDSYCPPIWAKKWQKMLLWV